MIIDEKTYVTVINRVKVSIAIHAIKEMLPMFDGVITEEARTQVLKQLYEWEDALFAKINDGRS